jgi:alanine-glyoxylate transaminase / serine-glyoxylate transaminase / serine-pyruvate transaminase
MVHSRVLRAMATPLLGHLDPAFLSVMNDIQTGLRQVFATRNAFTIALSGTGSAGMEAAIVNVIEPGDTIIVGVNGVFGTRLATVAERCGGKTIRVEAPWGQIIEADAVEAALQRSGSVKAVDSAATITPSLLLMPSHRSPEYRSRWIGGASTSVIAAHKSV